MRWIRPLFGSLLLGSGMPCVASADELAIATVAAADGQTEAHAPRHNTGHHRGRHARQHGD